MPQYQEFSFQPPPRLEPVVQHADEKEGNCNHLTIMFLFAAYRELSGQSFRKRQPFRQPNGNTMSWTYSGHAMS